MVLALPHQLAVLDMMEDFHTVDAINEGGLHMGSQWYTMIKPTFQTEWLTLPEKEGHQVLEKIALLTQDPLPDGMVKQKLQDMNGKFHRIRAGNYYIFYTFEKPYINLLAIRPRNVTTYQEDAAAVSRGI